MTDIALLAAIKRHRTAYFAFAMDEMKRRREYEHACQTLHGETLEVWLEAHERDDEHHRLYCEKLDAEYALVSSPPTQYEELVAKMIAEFGE